MKAPMLSVIVISRNANHLLRQVLTSLNRQTLARNKFEIIVVDDASDPPAELVGEELADTFIRLETNVGRSAARNIGTARASGMRVVFLDGDVIPHSNMLKAHMQAGSHDAVVIGYCYFLTHSDGARAIANQDMMPDQREMLYLQNTCNLGKWPVPWQVFYTGNVSMSLELFRRTTGFDERFQGWGAEDAEMGYRLQRIAGGSRFVLARDAIGFHLHDARTRPHSEGSHRRNMEYFLRKHRTFDIELILADIPQSYLNLQQMVRNVLEVSKTGPSDPLPVKAPNILPRPCAVLFGDENADLPRGFHIFHPSLVSSERSTGLLGVCLPYTDDAFGSVLITSRCFKLPDLYAAMLLESARIGKSVFLQLPPSTDASLLETVRRLGFSVQPVARDQRLWTLKRSGD